MYKKIISHKKVTLTSDEEGGYIEYSPVKGYYFLICTTDGRRELTLLSSSFSMESMKGSRACFDIGEGDCVLLSEVDRVSIVKHIDHLIL